MKNSDGKGLAFLFLSALSFLLGSFLLVKDEEKNGTRATRTPQESVLKQEDNKRKKVTPENRPIQWEIII